MSGRRHANAPALAALALTIAALSLGACGEEPDSETTTTAADTPPATQPTEPEPRPAEPGDREGDGGRPGDPPKPPAAGKPSGPAEGPDDDPRVDPEERAVIATVRRFVAALDAPDGDRACALLAPGAIEQVELPRDRGDCAKSLEASIGYRDPRGLPVWKGAEVTQVAVPELGDDTAKAVATVVTTFADREEYSVEDDVIYLERRRGQWLMAKPSSTVYRAVGIADVPPTVLAPPQG